MRDDKDIKGQNNGKIYWGFICFGWFTVSNRLGFDSVSGYIGFSCGYSDRFVLYCYFNRFHYLIDVTALANVLIET
jgi:hypothetical protein